MFKCICRPFLKFDFALISSDAQLKQRLLKTDFRVYCITCNVTHRNQIKSRAMEVLSTILYKQRSQYGGGKNPKQAKNRLRHGLLALCGNFLYKQSWEEQTMFVFLPCQQHKRSCWCCHRIYWCSMFSPDTWKEFVAVQKTECKKKSCTHTHTYVWGWASLRFYRYYFSYQYCLLILFCKKTRWEEINDKLFAFNFRTTLSTYLMFLARLK